MTKVRKPLTPKMIEALQHLADGDSRVTAARKLGISLETFKERMKLAYFRLDAHKLAQAIAEGFRRGLLK